MNADSEVLSVFFGTTCKPDFPSFLPSIPPPSARKPVKQISGQPGLPSTFLLKAEQVRGNTSGEGGGGRMSRDGGWAALPRKETRVDMKVFSLVRTCTHDPRCHGRPSCEGLGMRGILWCETGLP